MPSASAERFVYLIKIYLGHPEVTRRQCTNTFRGRRYQVVNDCSVYHKSTITTTGWKIKPDSSKLKCGTNYLMTARETAGIGWLGTLSPLWRLTRTDCTQILQQFFRRSCCCLGAETWACGTFLISLPALLFVKTAQKAVGLPEMVTASRMQKLITARLLTSRSTKSGAVKKDQCQPLWTL